MAGRLGVHKGEPAADGRPVAAGGGVGGGLHLRAVRKGGAAAGLRFPVRRRVEGGGPESYRFLR